MPIRFLFPLAACLALAACGGANPPTAAVGSTAAATARTSADDGADFGALSALPPAPSVQSDLDRSTDWAPAMVTSGSAFISCETDYAMQDVGTPIANLEFFTVLDALSACQEKRVVRLTYRGKIAADFTTLMERVAEMATRMQIPNRILDIDSSGGHVEDAIVAGDAMAESGWTIWVREGAVCHSACVLVLAAGDNRLVGGKVGVHRIMRIQSSATSRAELNRELSQVHGEMESYLARNGAAVAVADLMMTVPNRSLRLLTDTELLTYGLSGTNAAQDDLVRIRLARQCGEDFVRRRDAFNRAFERDCSVRTDVEGKSSCGLALRGKFGFPDRTCRAESPLAEYNDLEAAVSGNTSASR
jgi:ATP-dependent protease ClpP protease subunit